MVRSGFIPGVDYAPAMQGPQTDAELLTEALGDFAEVTPEERWSGVLDRRWMAINTNDDAASRPHLVDRRGRAIDRRHSAVTAACFVTGSGCRHMCVHDAYGWAAVQAG